MHQPLAILQDCINDKFKQAVIKNKNYEWLFYTYYDLRLRYYCTVISTFPQTKFDSFAFIKGFSRINKYYSYSRDFGCQSFSSTGLGMMLSSFQFRYDFIQQLTKKFLRILLRIALKQIKIVNQLATL